MISYANHWGNVQSRHLVKEKMIDWHRKQGGVFYEGLYLRTYFMRHGKSNRIGVTGGNCEFTC